MHVFKHGNGKNAVNPEKLLTMFSVCICMRGVTFYAKLNFGF